MSKVGAHVTGSQRNGFGDFCTSRPAVVLAANEGGALKEAWDLGNCHPITIFRDTKIYADAPQGIDQATPQQAIALADQNFPQLNAIWDQNPADYYTGVNEPFDMDLESIPSYLAYEARLMVLAEQVNKRMCVLNLATGTPGDFQFWIDVVVPHIKRAFKGGHIYGRHAYSMTDNLVPLDGNTGRPLKEAEYLRSINQQGGIVITELGFNGGYGYVGTDHFVDQVIKYEAEIRPHSNIIGFCTWELGETQFKANWENATLPLARWMGDEPTPRWYPNFPQEDVTPDEPARGVDISHHQVSMNWDQTVAAGASFAYIRVTRDVSFVDAVGTKEWPRAKEAGLYVGPYHYYHCALDPIVQADHFVNHIPSDSDLRPAIDLEDRNNVPLDIRGRVLLFLERVEGRIGLKPIIYTSPGWWNEFIGNVPWAKNYELWVAHWGVSSPMLPNGFNSWTFWQYIVSENGPGWGSESARIDLDVFNGTVADLDAYVSDLVAAPPGGCLDFPVHTRKFLLRPSDPTESQWITIKEMTGAEGIGEEGWSTLSGMKTVKDALDAGKSGSTLFVLDGKDIGDGLDANWFRRNCPEFLPHVVFVESEPTEPPVDPPLGDHDLIPYLRFEGEELNGPLYEVQTLGGGQERHQTQLMSGSTIFFFTKGGDGPDFPANWEELSFGGDFIYRRYDTSQAEDRYYELTDDLNNQWSKWCPTFMSVGQKYTRNPHVIHYNEVCEVISQGQTESVIELVAVHDSHQFFTGITLKDVIEMRVSGGGLNERYWYAKGYGLVGFQDPDVKSAISEIHDAGSRPDNVRKVIPCL